MAGTATVDQTLLECAKLVMPLDVRLGFSLLLATADVARCATLLKKCFGDSYTLIKAFVAVRLAEPVPPTKL